MTVRWNGNPKGKTVGDPELYEVIVSQGSSYGVCDTRTLAGALPRYFRVSTAGLRTCSVTPRNETAYDDLLRDCNVIVHDDARLRGLLQRGGYGASLRWSKNANTGIIDGYLSAVLMHEIQQVCFFCSHAYARHRDDGCTGCECALPPYSRGSRIQFAKGEGYEIVTTGNDYDALGALISWRPDLPYLPPREPSPDEACACGHDVDENGWCGCSSH